MNIDIITIMKHECHPYQMQKLSGRWLQSSLSGHNTHLILSYLIMVCKKISTQPLRLLPWVISKAPYFGVIKALFSRVAIDLLWPRNRNRRFIADLIYHRKRLRNYPPPVAGSTAVFGCDGAPGCGANLAQMYESSWWHEVFASSRF